jgi:hypothetical protein
MPRSARKNRNRELFRQVNEKIAELERFRSSEDTLSLICECRRLGCGDHVEVPAAVYATLTKDGGSAFVVLRGHEDPEHEDVVTDHGSFLVVRERQPV